MRLTFTSQIYFYTKQEVYIFISTDHFKLNANSLDDILGYEKYKSEFLSRSNFHSVKRVSGTHRLHCIRQFTSSWYKKSTSCISLIDVVGYTMCSYQILRLLDTCISYFCFWMICSISYDTHCFPIFLFFVLNHLRTPIKSIDTSHIYWSWWIHI